MKPIKLYTHVSGPNGWKVNILLRELELPFEQIFMEFDAMKQEPFLYLTPNGRVPVIEDPNTNTVLFESVAILHYLVSTYDVDHKLSFAHNSKAYHQAHQWLAFQSSTQGPYMGQAVWFMNYHPEPLPSAIRRYQEESIRVVGVIDRHLRTNGQQFLVSKDSGGDFSYVDVAFIPWADGLHWILRDREDIFVDGAYQYYASWLRRCKERSHVKESLADRDRVIAEKSGSLVDKQLKANADAQG